MLYNAEPRLDITQLPENPLIIRVQAGLCQREWERKVKIEVGESGNFKLYLGFGLGAIGTAGTIYGGYKLYQYIKSK